MSPSRAAAPHWTRMPASTHAASANTACSSGARWMTPFEISQSTPALIDSAHFLFKQVLEEHTRVACLSREVLNNATRR
jgi:hypothetical protein